MYLKRVNGHRQVTLPDGRILTQADLPSPDTKRWVASRKAVVVYGVKYGLLSESEALNRYEISPQEFASWCILVEKFGDDALKTTKTKKYLQP